MRLFQLIEAVLLFGGLFRPGRKSNQRTDNRNKGNG